MTELGILLYQRLLSAPSFRYALVGVEVDEFRTYNELLEDLPNLAFPGERSSSRCLARSWFTSTLSTF